MDNDDRAGEKICEKAERKESWITLIGKKVMLPYTKLKIYQLAYKCAIKLFHLSKSFPEQETYALTQQIRRSSRSVCGNLVKAYATREHLHTCIHNLSNSYAEIAETAECLERALERKYISPSTYKKIIGKYDQIERQLDTVVREPQKWMMDERSRTMDERRWTMD